MRIIPLLRRARSANTLVELILYMALTLIIIVGLSNIVSRLKQAELSGTVKTDVQQSVRATIQQFTGLAQLYESGSVITKDHLPAPAGEAGSGVLLWNAVQNQNLEPGELPRNYLRFWLEGGVIYTQSYANGQGQSTRVPVTPEGILVSTLDFRDVSGDSADAVLSIHIIAKDNSPSENIRDQFEWNITSAVTLRPRNELAGFCCPSYLNFCPVGFPLCENNGCFAMGQSGSDLLGQFTVIDGEEIVSFTTSDPHNGTGLANSGGFVFPTSLTIIEGSALFVADASNLRVLQFDLTEDSRFAGRTATAVFGQPNFESDDSWPVSETSLGSVINGMAYNRETEYLFISDSQRNRVLGFDLNDSDPVARQTADFVIGQITFNDSGAASPPSATSLKTPAGIVFDYANKRAFIADNGNHRILVYDLNDEYDFPEREEGTPITADYVLGQTSFSNVATTSLNRPWGLAVSNTHLFVTNSTSNKRVLAYTGSTFLPVPQLNNPAYTLTRNYPSSGSPTSRVDNPTSLTFDSMHQRLFVSDSVVTNSRVLAFSGAAASLHDDMSSLYVLGNPSFALPPPPSSSTVSQQSISLPMGIAYDSTNQRLFIADMLPSRVLVYDAGGPECNNAEYFEPPAGAQTSVASSSSSNPSGGSDICTPFCEATDWDDCNLYESIDDEFVAGTPPNAYESNTDDFIEACGPSDGGSFILSDTPSGFSSAQTITIRVHYRLNDDDLSGGENPTGFSIVLQQNGTSITPPTVLSSSIDTGWRYWQTELPFSGSQANDQATWDDAVVKIQNVVLPGGIPSVKISAVEVVLDYVDGTPKQATLKPVADSVGNQWTRIGDPPSFNPNLWSGLSLWLLAGSGTLNGVSEATNGQPVSTWLDRKTTHATSPVLYSATQTGGTKQPTLVTNAVNGHPAVHFDGIDDGMVTARMSNQFESGYTFFYVISLDDGQIAPATAPRYLFGSKNGLFSYYFVTAQKDGDVYHGVSTSPFPSSRRFATGGSLYLPDGQTPFNVFTGVASPSGANMSVSTYFDGAPSVTSPATISNWSLIKAESSEKQHLGHFLTTAGPSNYTAMRVAEVIIYNRGLTSTERCAVQSYLDTKYNLGLTPCP